MAKFIHEGDQKKKYVKQMFNDISSTYDIINIISSFGIDRYWRYKLVNKIKMTSGQKLLDVATGTGDVAFGFYKKYDINKLVEPVLQHLNKKGKFILECHKKQVPFLEAVVKDYGHTRILYWENA